MKISVCVTTYNEQETIGNLLDSLLSQSKKPNEIVVVDAGSTDKTLEIIRHYQKKDKRIKVVKEPGSIANGRNTAIEVSGGEIVVMTDAGCVAKTDWLKKIIEPIIHLGGARSNISEALRDKDSVSVVVAGFYDMPANNAFQKAARVYLGVMPSRFDPQRFLPSARSVAFRKNVWERLGGFNEKLERGAEDTEFFYRCVKNGVKIFRVEKARVIWKETGKMDLNKFLRKVFTYSKGDAQAKIWFHPVQCLSSHNIKILSIYIRYILGLFLFLLVFIGHWPLAYLLICLFAYLLWPIWKWRNEVADFNARLWLPVIQVSSDFAVMAGFLSGIFSKNEG